MIMLGLPFCLLQIVISARLSELHLYLNIYFEA